MENQNYTLGRGEIHLGLFLPGTTVTNGERYIGNTPTFSMNVEATNLDHYSSDRGVREKDDSVVTQVNRNANLVTDSIQVENLALFFSGTTSIVSQSPQSAQTDTFVTPSIPGNFYQIGVNAARPQGVRGISGVTVQTGTTGTGTSAVLGTDYNLDTARARIEVIPGGVLAGQPFRVAYTVLANSRKRIISGNQPVSGALRYIAQNPKGDRFDWYMPYVTVRPNGDFALKGDEWQQVPLMVEVLRLPGMEAVYIDGQPSGIA